MLNKKLVTVGMIGLLAVGMVGCGNKTETPKDDNDTKQEQQVAVNVDLTKTFEKITTEYNEKMSIGLPLTMDNLDMAYPNVSMRDLVEDCSGAIPMMNVKVDEVTIFKAKEGQVEAVKTALKERQDAQIASFEQYLPDQYEIIKESKIFEKGNYVYFISAEPDNFTGIQTIIEDALAGK